jgi:hypothetical protein
MAITPSCSWSSFFQLLNKALNVGLPALSNGPPTVGGEAAAVHRRLDHRGVDMPTAERRLNESLALLDHACAGFGRGGEGSEFLALSRVDQAGGGKGRPGDEHQDDGEKEGLEGSRDPEAAEP